MARGVTALELADRYFEELLEDQPLLGTMIGDERYDDRLPDIGETGRARRAEHARSALEDLARIPRGELDLTARTALDVVEAVATRELAELEHRLDLLQVVSHLWGPGQLLAEIGTYQRADTPERLERYLARLAATPTYYAAAAEVVREGAAAGITAPRIVVERTIAQVERLLGAPLEDSPALMPVPAEDHEGRERLARLLREVVHPALGRYLEALRAYLPSATETIGLGALPGGEAMYAVEVLAHTTLPLDPREVHALGLAQLEAIQEERRASARRLGYDDPREAVAALARRAASPDELLRLAEAQVQRAWEVAPAFFGRLPSDSCEVRLVEAFRERDMPFAFYHPPSMDGSRRGVYYVNAHELGDKPLHQLATTTYHESNPGHHFQIALEQEMGDRPAIRRFAGYLTGTAFCEGWGLYAERLADEMGLFEDELERLGMLEMQAMRAARLVVDTGIHALGWPRERAVALLREAGVAPSDAGIEVDRYVTLPGQALAYKIGQIEIERLRAAAASRGVPAREFHDAILALGTLPLPALARELG